MRPRRRKKKTGAPKPVPSPYTKGYVAWMIGCLCVGLFATLKPLLSPLPLSETTGGSYKFGASNGLQTLLIGITALSAAAYLFYGYCRRK